MSTRSRTLNAAARAPMFQAATVDRPAHAMVAGVASCMAAEVYEVLAKDNAFYQAHPDMQAFVDVNWRGFLGDARNSLVDSLSSPNLTDKQKAEVQEALTLDYGFLQAADRRSVGDIRTGALLN